MEQPLGDRPGGIAGLCWLLAKHGDAIEYDLLALGYRLDDLGEGLSWRDLWVVVTNAPPGSALVRAIAGHVWSVTDYLLASVIDQLATANWQRQGKASARRPKPIPRPGVEDENTKVYGREPIPISQFDDWWNTR